MSYTPATNRYENMRYNRCGKSGLQFPAISLGLWHNFGGDTPVESGRAMEEVLDRRILAGITDVWHCAANMT